MSEKIIAVEAVEPVELYGVNDHKLNLLKSYFPKLKIVARGYSIKLIGDEPEIEKFEKKFDLLIEYYHKFLENHYKQFHKNILSRLIADDCCVN